MRALRAQPVRPEREPAYPTKLAVVADPNLLQSHVPQAWLTKREIAGALGAFLAANAAGCSEKTAGPTGAGGPANANDKAAIVAPLFEHGRGEAPSRFALSCVAVAAPSYLPEEDAIRIIVEELQSAGLSTSTNGLTFSNIIIHGRELREGYEWVSACPGPGFEEVSGPLHADLFDPQLHVAIKFVAESDFDRLGGRDEDGRSMDFKEVATSVGQRVRKDGHGVYFAAFYDPIVYSSFGSGVVVNKTRPSEVDMASDEIEAQLEARRLLRKQVSDFIAWLKGQGVI